MGGLASLARAVRGDGGQMGANSGEDGRGQAGTGPPDGAARGAPARWGHRPHDRQASVLLLPLGSVGSACRPSPLLASPAPSLFCITGVSLDKISARLFTCLPQEDPDQWNRFWSEEVRPDPGWAPLLEAGEPKAILVCGCDTESLKSGCKLRPNCAVDSDSGKGKGCDRHNRAASENRGWETVPTKTEELAGFRALC